MRNGSHTITHFTLPATAHEQLQALRDQLHLLAALAECGGDTHEDDALIVPRPGMMHCFNHLALLADHVLADAMPATAH